MSGMTTFSAEGASALMRLSFPSRWGWSGRFSRTVSAPRARAGRPRRSRGCARGLGPAAARARVRRRPPRAPPSGRRRRHGRCRAEPRAASERGHGRPRISGRDRLLESRKRAASHARPRRRPPGPRGPDGQPAGRSPCRRRRRASRGSSLRSPGSGHAPEQRLELVHEVAEILEPAVNGREPHVRHLIELLELLHDLGAELHGRHLARLSRRESRLDLVADGLERLRLDGTLLTGFHEAAEQLVAVERLAPAVLLHDEKGDLLDGLVGREAALAGVALPPPADRRSFAALARVDDAVVSRAAVRAAHGTEPSQYGATGPVREVVGYVREKRRATREGEGGQVAGVLRSRADGIRPLLAARGTRGEL